MFRTLNIHLGSVNLENMYLDYSGNVYYLGKSWEITEIEL